MGPLALLRHLVPRRARRRVSVELARMHSARLDRDLAALAADTRPIVAGPWLGEVGFELLYWVPFLAWFSERFGVDSGRLIVVSRGGTSPWYSPFAGTYHEVFDYVSADEFRRLHDARVAENGEQKQTRVTAAERDLLAQITRRLGPHDCAYLHPSRMYGLFNPFWWAHVDERWVHRHTRYRRFEPPAARVPFQLPVEYVAVKFYFNDCFPPTDANRSFVRDTVRAVATGSPVVSLTPGLDLDDHGGCDVGEPGMHGLPPGIEPRDNLRVQSAIVAGARAFVGTYGGFSYLAPLYGVRSIAYYSDPAGFSQRHLAMARSAFTTLGVDDLLEVRSTRDHKITTQGEARTHEPLTTKHEPLPATSYQPPAR